MPSHQMVDSQLQLRVIRPVKLYVSYSFVSGKTTSTITARLDHATDTLYRNHLNFLNDLAPEMGRTFRVVYNVKF